MKLKYKDRFKKDVLYKYLEKLKSFDFEKFPVIKAIMNYFKKAKMIVFISLFFALHGIGIIEESIMMLGNNRGFDLWLGVGSRINSDMGFVIGTILIVNAIGLINRRKIFYYSAIAIVFSFMVYISVSLVSMRDMFVSSVDPSVAFLMIAYLILYGAVFGNLVISMNEIK